jgi:L-ascorbate metabolism protein UlaG (beta-lactamase superfamily)
MYHLPRRTDSLKILYHGHSCVQITEGEHSLVIDPFLTDNPVARSAANTVSVQAVLLTHAHSDHILDAEEITRRNSATLVGSHELATYYSWKGLETIGMNIGGTIDLGFANVKMTQAFHSSGMVLDDEQRIIYMGMPAGYVIQWGGLTVLHAGDTALFGDMKLIGEQHDIDLAFLPIGDRFTMGPDDALIAAEWLRARAVVPIHHSTWPPIAQNAAKFTEELNKKGIRGIPMAPGEELIL